jgi:hypothetical protein
MAKRKAKAASENRPKRGANATAFKPGRSGNPGGVPKTVSQIREKLLRLGPKAVMRLSQLMRQTDDPKTAVRAAEAILDRGGVRPFAADEINTAGIDLARVAATLTLERVRALEAAHGRTVQAAGSSSTPAALAQQADGGAQEHGAALGPDAPAQRRDGPLGGPPDSPLE